MAAVAIAYFAAARLGLAVAFLAEQVTLVWPPSGIAVAALVVFGRRAAVGVFAGAFAANATIGEPLLTASGIAIGNTTAALAGLWLLRQARFSRYLERIWDVLALLGLAGATASVASATIGVTSLCLTGLHPWSAFGALWWIWWLGDTMGVVLAAPVLLATGRRVALPLPRVAEVILLFGLLTAAALVVFSGRILPVRELAYLVFPPVIWAALRFRQRETAAAIAIIASVAVWGTVRGYGPFVGRSAHESLVLLQAFMAVVAATGLVLCAAIAERRTGEKRRATDYALSQILAASPTLEVAAPRILQAVGEGLEWDLAVLWTPEDGVLRCRDVWHDARVPAPHFLQGTRERALARGEGLPGRVWESGEPHWISDVVVDRNFPRAPLAAADGLHSGFAFPIRLAGDVLGVVECFSREVRPPDADLLHMFAVVGAQVGVFLERRRIEQERTHLLAELRRAGQAKDEFLAVLGHELRNPLAPMRNALEVLRARGWPDAASQHMGDVIDRQLRHMVRLVDDLLDVSRITRGRVELRKERLDLTEVVGRVVEAARSLLSDRRQDLVLALSAEPVFVYGDPTRLEQVVSNLLHNAVRYTDPGGRIAVRASAEGGTAVLRVEDTGIGLRPEMLERIFEPFVQGQRASSQQPSQGLGIGLSLVRSLVEMHHGSVAAASAGPGRGSVFTVRLPLAARPAAAAGEDVGEHAPARSDGAPRRRVLVVDDNVDGADSLALVLRRSGHEVVVAYDGREALAQSERQAFDVVLLDIGLPDDLDGYEVARRLRAAEAAPPPVLIALTGFGQPEDHRRSREAGFARHLVKPVDPRELERLLDVL
jgi:signal transduction histidine kinase/CheY-like chemotaxis protein/integral membrane sensor domain MASE1